MVNSGTPPGSYAPLLGVSHSVHLKYEHLWGRLAILKEIFEVSESELFMWSNIELNFCRRFLFWGIFILQEEFMCKVYIFFNWHILNIDKSIPSLFRNLTSKNIHFPNQAHFFLSEYFQINRTYWHVNIFFYICTSMCDTRFFPSHLDPKLSVPALHIIHIMPGSLSSNWPSVFSRDPLWTTDGQMDSRVAGWQYKHKERNWSERSACAALGCWHKRRWPL